MPTREERISNTSITWSHIIGATLLFFFILIKLLIWPAPLGMADNHDYWRLMNPFGFVYQNSSPGFFDHVEVAFLTTGSMNLEIWSSGLLFTGLAYLISFLWSTESFSVLWLGFVHIVFYTLSFFLFLRAVANKSLLQLFIFFILGVLIFADTLFTAYFNSFYQESAFLICFLAFISLLIASKKTFTYELVLLLLVAISKVPEVVFLILLLPLLIKYWHIEKKIKLLCFSSLIVLLVLGNLFTQASRAGPNTFNSFFKGVVTEQNASEILTDFSLPYEQYSVYVGKDFWNAPNFEGKTSDYFYQKVNHFKIATYYLTHPALFLERLLTGVDKLRTFPWPDNLGNHTQAFNSQRVIDTFTFPVLARNLFWLLPIGLIFSWFQMFYLLYKKYFDSVSLLLIIFSPFLILQIIVAFLGDGYHDFAKHNLPFFFSFALWLILSINFWYSKLSSREKLSI